MVKKLFFVMLTGMICFSSCFCETAFAKTSKVRVYDVEKYADYYFIEAIWKLTGDELFIW